MNKIIVKKSEFEKLYKMACTTWIPKLNEKLQSFVFSDYIEFDLSFVQEMEKACTKDQLKVFKEIFTEYKSDSLFDIKTYREVCSKLGEEESTDPYIQIKQIQRLFNGKWKPDWSNSNEKKYYPYFNTASGDWVFDGSTYSYDYYCGMVAYYKDEQTAIYVGKTFIDIYKKFSQM